MKHFDENCLKKLTELPKMMVKEVQDKYEQVARLVNIIVLNIRLVVTYFLPQITSFFFISKKINIFTL